MSVVDSGVIYLRQGDTETLSIGATVSGSAYTFNVGDVLTLTARETPGSDTVVLTATKTVTVSGTTQTITIPASTMEEVAPGRYSCDIELCTTDGVVKTIFPVTDVTAPLYNTAKTGKI